MRRITSRFTALQDESGSALVASILILSIISMLGTVVLQATNVESHQTARERAGELAFNLAESALDAEASLLQNSWPSTSASAYPICNQASTTGSTCPQGSVSGGFSTTYAGGGFASPTWSVQVVDDDATGVADTSYYSDSILTNGGLAHWDSNGDNKLWVRADATIQGQHRILVASVGRQSNVVSLPQAVVTSGGLTTSNNGNKVIIEAKDSNSGLSGSVDLRCNGAPGFSGTCAGWDPGKGQLDPSSVVQTNYVDPTNSFQTLTDGVLNQLRQTAQAQGTYYPPGQCPPEGTPGLLFIENDTSNPCSYNGSGGVSWNSDAAPGAIVVATGTLAFNGNTSFYGVVYMADGQGSAPTSGMCTATEQNTVFTVHGGGSLHGGLFVDKCGTVDAGDKAFDIVYDVKAFGGVQTYAQPSLEQNTFRLLGNSGH
jgi:Tfp pilus assembly protein PilX